MDNKKKSIFNNSKFIFSIVKGGDLGGDLGGNPLPIRSLSVPESIRSLTLAKLIDR